MATEVQYGASATNEARTGGDVDWSNPGNSNGNTTSTYADAVLDFSSSQESSNFLRSIIDNFSATGTINSVKPAVYSKYTDADNMTIYILVSANDGSSYCSGHSVALTTTAGWKEVTCSHHSWTATNIDQIRIRSYVSGSGTLFGTGYIYSFRATVDYTAVTTNSTTQLSDSRIKTIGNTYQRLSDSRTKVLGTIYQRSSDSRTKVLGTIYQQLSDSRTKVLGTTYQRLSDSRIKVQEITFHKLSDSRVKVLGTIYQRQSDSRIKNLGVVYQRLSDSHIRIINSDIELFSDSRIRTNITSSLISDSRIKKLDNGFVLLSSTQIRNLSKLLTTLSDSRIKQTSSGIYPPIPIQEKIHYRFDSGAEEKISGLISTEIGTITYPIFGIGKGALFTGNGRLEVIGYPFDQHIFSLSFWIRHTNSLPMVSEQVIFWRGSQSWGVKLTVDGRIRFFTNTSENGGGLGSYTEITTSQILSTNQIYHVLCIYNPVERLMSIYINGSIQSQGFQQFDVNGGGQYAYIGGNDISPSFHGYIDEFRLWQRTIEPETPDEIQTMQSLGISSMSRIKKELSNTKTNDTRIKKMDIKIVKASLSKIIVPTTHIRISDSRIRKNGIIVNSLSNSQIRKDYVISRTIDSRIKSTPKLIVSGHSIIKRNGNTLMITSITKVIKTNAIILNSNTRIKKSIMVSTVSSSVVRHPNKLHTKLSDSRIRLSNQTLKTSESKIVVLKGKLDVKFTKKLI
jgi:hypothetical protein